MKPIGWKFGDYFTILNGSQKYALLSENNGKLVKVSNSVYTIEEINDFIAENTWKIIKNSKEMQINLQNLVQGKRYLVKNKNPYYTTINEFQIKEVSEKAYAYSVASANLFSNKIWILKEDFNKNYEVIEELQEPEKIRPLM